MATEDDQPPDPDFVRRLARLARLEIDPARAALLAAELRALGEDLDLLRRIDIRGVEPAGAAEPGRRS